jgi:tRNA (guanine26-N2/guanine27-N2)-dimethyltransferase
MDLLKEGNIEFSASTGEPKKKMPVFFNSYMEFDRSLTVEILKALGMKNLSYCDIMAGSGVRGMRALAESGGVGELSLNDHNEVAVGLIKENLARNNLDAHVSNEDANLFLRQHRCDKFDILDIDPFGSFGAFIDSALRAVKRKQGLLCLTATDTAPLCGVAVKACLRKYDARPLRSAYAKEVGLRILIGFAVREAARYEMAIRPIFSYNRRHYFRLFLETHAGVKKADSALKGLGYLQHCFACGWRAYTNVDSFESACSNCGSQLSWAGPLWVEEFADSAFCKKIDVPELADVISREQDILLPFYETSKICEIYKAPTPSRETIFKTLKGSGYDICKTSFSKTGFRTNAPISEISEVFKIQNKI